MKIVYQDLLNFLSEKPSKDLLSEKLFQLGHEHDVFDDVFDIEITPNRGDCLSLLGLARDLNPFFSSNTSIDIYEDEMNYLEFNLKNLSKKDCPQISFIEIEIENNISEYKPYLNNFFNTIGGSKINLFTDISNYISYELGQPTHCYERDTIADDLTFENKVCDVSFKTLLGSEIELKGNNCVFSLKDKIISLAGVMGGDSTSCSKNTNKVLVECAFFNPESIIGKSTKYNLISDAAHKFERGVDINAQEFVLRRFVKIVQDHAEIKSVRFKSFSFEEQKSTFLSIDTSKINKILGTELSDSEYINYLKSLGFQVNDCIKVPSFRNDIKTQNDLAEEIARVIGYNNITSNAANFANSIDSEEIGIVSKIESFLTKNGFSEVINYPFTYKKEEKSIKIDNPLYSNRSYFRTSLMDSLIDNLLYNERRQKDHIKLFEISDIYTKTKNIDKEKKLGIIISGRLGNNYRDFSKKLDNKYLFKLLASLTKNKSLKIIEISRDNLDTKKKDKIFYTEISINSISKSFLSNVKKDKTEIDFISYSPISDYPSSTRDFSFLITNIDLVSSVIDILENQSDEIIKDAFIFDFYKNNKTNSVKVGYRITFQSQMKTLSEKDITSKVKEIIEPILELDGVSIPGM